MKNIIILINIDDLHFRERGFVDLLNGPQDHGWCFGYTCQKRLSTFPAVVAMGDYIQ